MWLEIYLRGQRLKEEKDNIQSDKSTLSPMLTKRWSFHFGPQSQKSQKGVFANSKINRTSVVSGHLYKTSATQGYICATRARCCRRVGPRWNLNFPEEAVMQTGPEARLKFIIGRERKEKVTDEHLNSNQELNGKDQETKNQSKWG